MDSSVGGGHIPAKGYVQVVGVTIIKGGLEAIGMCLSDHAGRDVSSWNTFASVIPAPVPILVLPEPNCDHGEVPPQHSDATYWRYDETYAEFRDRWRRRCDAWRRMSALERLGYMHDECVHRR